VPVAGPAGCRGGAVQGAKYVAALRQARLDVLGDLVAEHLDTAALSRLIEHGPPPGMPSLLVSLNHDR